MQAVSPVGAASLASEVPDPLLAGLESAAHPVRLATDQCGIVLRTRNRPPGLLSWGRCLLAACVCLRERHLSPG